MLTPKKCNCFVRLDTLAFIYLITRGKKIRNMFIRALTGPA